jgi:magnesium transporter
MSQEKTKTKLEKSYFLSELIGNKVMLNGKRIGKLADVIIVEAGKVPKVTTFYIVRRFGNPSLLVPWEKVKLMTDSVVVIDVDDLKKFEGSPDEKAVLLKDHIIDKKVLDFEGMDVDMVYDARLVVSNGKLYVSEVDCSRYGMLRRIGLGNVANFIYDLANSIKKQTISWKYIQPLPTQIGSFNGEVKLNVLKEKLSDIPSVDLADMIEELDPDQRVMIFDKLETSHASDTLEEIDPNIQRELVSSLKKEKVAELINAMTPAQAADVLSILPWEDAEPILNILDKANLVKIKAILDQHEENIINYATSKFIKLPPDMTVGQAEENYPNSARDMDVVMYLYVVDNEGKLLGLLDIKELLKARHDATLKEVMIPNIISLKPTSTLKEASTLFTRYDYRAIPVVDSKERIVGVVPYRDVMKLKHMFVK